MQNQLFSNKSHYEPLASRMRPKTLDGYMGQDHLLGEGKALRRVIESGQLHSMIFWGPPGVGKTTLARLLASYVNAEFLAISAVMDGVKEIRACIEQAKHVQQQGRLSLLFVDEVHRFNKSQQDAFLPFVEDGTVIFIGATTENPSFELNSALLSRARVYKLRGLTPEHLKSLLISTLEKDEILKEAGLSLEDEAADLLANIADGDARRSLNLLEMAADLVQADDENIINKTLIQEVVQESVRRFDKGGDLFYEQISALHKSVRGSNVDGALYWFVRMLDGGCDPLYIARRVVRMASEDIGNADPRALEISMNAWMAYERLGSPEGELVIAQAISYLACAPKSNAVYNAYNEIRALVSQTPSYDVPLHLRNAPTELMKDEEYGAEYRYAHDEPEAYAAGENYLPEPLKHERFYQPVDRGLEIKLKAKLEHLARLDEASTQKKVRRLMHYLIIAIGGALGAMTRAFLSAHFTKLLGTGFPFATLAINVLGSFLMGICAVIILDYLKMTGYWRELIMVGFLGALTTFSTFSIEGFNLLHSGQIVAALTYFIVSVLGCVLACFAGWYLTKLFI